MTAREVLLGSAFSVACTDSSLPPRKVHRKGNINSKDVIIPIQKTLFSLVPSSATSGDISVPSTAFILQHPLVRTSPSPPPRHQEPRSAARASCWNPQIPRSSREPSPIVLRDSLVMLRAIATNSWGSIVQLFIPWKAKSRQAASPQALPSSQPHFPPAGPRGC